MRRLIQALALASLGALAAAQETPLATKVTVKYDHLPLAEVLSDLGQRAGVRFTFSEKLLEGYGAVTYQAQDQEVGRVANEILRPRRLRLGQVNAGVVALAKLDALDEFKLKREESFEFAEGLTVAREGDKATVSFSVKALCDVTVAIEDAEGRIVRHLASGVLGPNAPQPFQWNSKKQTLAWDGKDDKGEYIDEKDGLTVRVSLGLKPRFERAFQWSPHRRVGRIAPIICPTPEGVYLFEGYGFDHLSLFDHQGNYIRTIYPFPAEKVDAVKGVKRHVMPQSGRQLPLKWGMRESTLLTSGFTGIWEVYGINDRESAARSMAVGGGRIFLPYIRLNRLGTDGSSGGMELEGPETAVRLKDEIPRDQYWAERLFPRSAALSPDGKTLYLAGFVLFDTPEGWQNRWRWADGVARMDPLGSAPPRPFVGALKPGAGGSDDTHFKMPVSVACDAQGRVYVADYGNDRIQVLNPDGSHVKSIAVSKPAEVCVHQNSGDIYVFSWHYGGPYTPDKPNVPAMMHHFGPVSDPRELSSCPLPLRSYTPTWIPWIDGGGALNNYRAAVDSWTEPPTIWLVPTTGGGDRNLPWKEAGVVLLTEKDGKLAVKRDFTEDAEKTRPRLDPIPPRPRIYADPKTGKLYVGEGDSSYEGKSFRDLIEIDPATGRQRIVQIPFDAEDMAFDRDGLAYLRSLGEIARYDPATWREVPFDYGEARDHVGTGSMSSTKYARTSGAIIGLKTAWHQGGLAVSPNGNVVASFYYAPPWMERRTEQKAINAGKPYTPVIFPGRLGAGAAVVNVWDKHGNLVRADAVPGLGILDGLAMDKNDDLYVMSACTRAFDGQRYFDLLTGTGIKFRFGQAKVLTASEHAPVPLAEETTPKRPRELALGRLDRAAWTEGAKWFYGGVGYTGKNHPFAGGCACWNARFTLDYFARSFWPEIQHYSVAVLDTNGNLILRVGRCGNVDDGQPLVAEGGPPNPRSIGGDEVALFYAPYLATDTDRRLFIADPGNGRIVSVKLGYHAEEKVRLSDVPDQARR